MESATKFFTAQDVAVLQEIIVHRRDVRGIVSSTNRWSNR
jgi:hypothetical protein